MAEMLDREYALGKHVREKAQAIAEADAKEYVEREGEWPRAKNWRDPDTGVYFSEAEALYFEDAWEAIRDEIKIPYRPGSDEFQELYEEAQKAYDEVFFGED